MRNLRWLALSLAGLASGCGVAQLQVARSSLQNSLTISVSAQQLMTWLGLLPDYSCGAPQADALVAVATGLTQRVPCATVSTQPLTPGVTRVQIDFPAGGCKLAGRSVKGQVAVDYDQGDSRVDVTLDLSQLEVDGHRVAALGGYHACGDASSAWISAGGTVRGRAFVLQGTLSQREGGLLGATAYQLSGVATLQARQGEDAVRFDNLTYETGELFPSNGAVAVKLSGGDQVDISFDPSTGFLRPGEAVVRVDGGPPAKIPVLN